MYWCPFGGITCLFFVSVSVQVPHVPQVVVSVCEHYTELAELLFTSPLPCQPES